MPFQDSSPLLSTLVAGLVLGGVVLGQVAPDSSVGSVMFWAGIALVGLFVVSLVLDAASSARAKGRVRAALEALAGMAEDAGAASVEAHVRAIEDGYVDRAVLDSVPGLVEAAGRPGPQRIPVLRLGLRHGSPGTEPWNRAILQGEPFLREAELDPEALERLDRWIEIDAAIRRRNAEEGA